MVKQVPKVTKLMKSPGKVLERGAKKISLAVSGSREAVSLLYQIKLTFIILLKNCLLENLSIEYFENEHK